LPIFLALAVSSSAQQSELGEFEAQSHVGDVRHKGSVRFDAAKKEYQINASGENMWQDKDALHFVTVALSDPVYVGLGVCSHDVDTVATALFSNLSFVSEGVVSARDRVLESSLETISIETGERRLVYSTRDHIEAPNWSRDGKLFIFNSEGRIYTLPTQGGLPQVLNTAGALIATMTMASLRMGNGSPLVTRPETLR